jgi:hypothetical protein
MLDVTQAVAPVADTVTSDVSPRVFVLDARFDHGGAWAGVEPLIEAAWRDLRARGCDELLHQHHYALHMVLQDRRAEIPLAYASLTDRAVGAERTRNFPLDRAHRIVNALVDLVLTWRRMDTATVAWIVLARGLDTAQALARRFFTELARRSSGDIIVVSEQADSITILGDERAAVPVTIASATCDPLPTHDLAAAAVTLEACGDLRGESALIERHHPALLALHRHRGDELSAARLSLRILCLYNHFGYYCESGSFANAVLAEFDAIVGDDEDIRWNCIGNIFQGLVMIGRQAEARAVLEERALPHLVRADLRAKMHYVLAMYHLRYAAQPDIILAEQHIEAARAAIAAAKGLIDPADHIFFSVFVDNGLGSGLID